MPFPAMRMRACEEVTAGICNILISFHKSILQRFVPSFSLNILFEKKNDLHFAVKELAFISRSSYTLGVLMVPPNTACAMLM